MALLGILETAIGLAFIYLLLSMLCSGINEWLAHKLGRRGKCLRAGLLQIVPDRWTYLRLVAHPAIAALHRDMKGRIRHPSYIPSATFATALIDVIKTMAASIKGREAEIAGAAVPAPEPVAEIDLRSAARICAENGFPVGRSIEAVIDRLSVADETAARAQIAAWYDGAMGRVGGWYKRAARFQLFLIGLAAAVALNVDSLAIGTQLMQADTLRAMLVAEATKAVERGAPPPSPPSGAPAGAVPSPPPPSSADLRGQAAQLLLYREQGLRIGYACLDPQKVADPAAGLWAQVKACWHDRSGWGLTFFKVLGWLITAFAVSQGAPFWFDLMNRFVNLRGAGPKPKSPASPQTS
ncbi:MAG: hypothetical protein JNM30_03945 [Rhodospirillales bacterium]|nr:hypothetical protein [Rhodospirillales bacterium]